VSEARYSVWVAGSEVVTRPLTLAQAEDLETYWQSLGYDVDIEQVSS
jgi:hypothetical protein